MTISATPGMSLREIALAAYGEAPTGIDFAETPDGNIIFTDTARPREEFRVGPDTEYAGEDLDGVCWAEWFRDDDRDWEASGSDGCNLSDPTALIAALTRWINARPTSTDWDDLRSDRF